MPPEHSHLSITQLLRAMFTPGGEDCGDGDGELISWYMPHLEKRSQLMAIWLQVLSIAFPLTSIKYICIKSVYMSQICK